MARPRTTWDTALSLADRHAPFLRRLLRHEGDIPALLKQHGPEPLLKHVQARLEKIDPQKISPQELMRLLRECRGRAALIIALADLAGVWDVDTVTAALSAFADACIHVAVQTAVAEALKAKRLPLLRAARAAQMRSHGLACLALGKLGGRELNYSSDVDLIFFYDETRVLPGSDATEAWSRVVHQAARYLQDSTSDGYVFRVDLRLRPDPGATPPAISMAAAENYYQSAALSWERAAYTRARVCAGDFAAGNSFLQRLVGWVWRRNLDFTAIKDIQALREQILEHYDLADFSAAGFDVKRGIGGIREIEFLLQINQLIHGGRRTALRTSHTPDGMRALAAAGLIPAENAAALVEAYHWLRMVEHRLQMRDDEQTHSLPKESRERADVALFCGYATLAELDDALKNICARVRRIYMSILGQQSPQPVTPKARPVKITGLDETVARWQAGRYRALAHPRARAALEKIQPTLIDMLAAAPEPAAALLRWDRFLESLPSGVALLEMFEANPNLLGLLVRALSMSARTGEQLARHPHLLDAVLDGDFFTRLTQPSAQLQGIVKNLRETEAIWTATARWVGEKRFQLSVQMLEYLISPREASVDFSHVLDAAVSEMAAMAHAELAKSYGAFAYAAPIIVALGGWGGLSLGLSSDLDMIYLYSGSFEAQSSGAKSLTAGHYFNKLAPRITNLLTATSSEGAIADVDTRLRPSGAKGLLAVSVDSFRQYQLQDAWTWEHMALTRARVVCGPEKMFSKALADIYAVKRPHKKIIADILDMRSDMDTHRAAKSAWDMKLPPGGLVDIEFIIHALQLLHAHQYPEIIDPVLERAIEKLTAAQIIGAGEARDLQNALSLQSNMRAILTLCEQGDSTTAISRPTSRLLCHWANLQTARALESSLKAVRSHVLAIWQTVFGRART